MAVTYCPDACSLPTLEFHEQFSVDIPASLAMSRIPTKWIDELIFRTTVLSLNPLTTESEAEESLQRIARDLGLLLPEKKPVSEAVTASSVSATSLEPHTKEESVLSQSTAPTSCGSSERRPSTSLSQHSSKMVTHTEMPSIMMEMERRRSSGFKNGLRKMTGFRKKKTSGSSTPSIASMRSQMTGTTANESTQGPLRVTASIGSGNSDYSHESPVLPETSETDVFPEPNLQRSIHCEQLVYVQTQQLEEKRRFLEYQTRLIRQLLEKRDAIKEEKKKAYQAQVDEEEEKNEKAVEELEVRQLEDELRQQKEHEAEKRAMQTRLKHMEAYCQTPSPATSPVQSTFEHRPSIDSVATAPERHITQQHYENLAQAYHIRDNMDSLHHSKINVLRGKQKRTLQNFILKKERQMDQMEKDHNQELASIDREYAEQEAEIRHEFEQKRSKLEARWQLQALIEKARVEKSTGLKYDNMPEMVATEA